MSAQQILGNFPDLKSNNYLINFGGGINKLPKIALQNILQKSIEPDFLKGKVALIGFVKDAADIGFAKLAQEQGPHAGEPHEGLLLGRSVGGGLEF